MLKLGSYNLNDRPCDTHRLSTSAASAADILGNSVSERAGHDTELLPQPKQPVWLTQGASELSRSSTASSRPHTTSDNISLSASSE